MSTREPALQIVKQLGSFMETSRDGGSAWIATHHDQSCAAGQCAVDVDHSGTPRPICVIGTLMARMKRFELRILLARDEKGANQ